MHALWKRTTVDWRNSMCLTLWIAIVTAWMPRSGQAAEVKSAVLPEIETGTQTAALNLFAGTTHSIDDSDAMRTAGKLIAGDLAYRCSIVHRSLVALRGGTLRLWVGQSLAADRPDVQSGPMRVYHLRTIPCQLQFRTTRGEAYEVKVLSADESGARIEYWKSDGSPPEPELRETASETARSPENRKEPDDDNEMASKTELPPRERVLHFPPDRSLGEVHVLDADTSKDEEFFCDKTRQGNDEFLAPARGDVVVPAGKRVYLMVSGERALRDLSPLARLQPDDLDRLSIDCWQVTGIDVDRDILPHLSGLSGLKTLDLGAIEGIPRRLSGLAELKDLQYLAIRTLDAMFDRVPTGRALDTTGLTSLSKLKSVKSLFLGTGAVNDRTIEYVTQMPWLRELTIYNNRFQGSGLKHVAELPQLEYLFVGSKSMRPDNLRYVARCTSLRKLWLQEFPATDAHLTLLEPLQNLEILGLYDTAVTDRGFANLKPLQSLRAVLVRSKGARGSTLRDDGLVHLRSLPNLEEVELCGNDTTNAGIAHLAALPKLKKLRLTSLDYNNPEDDKYYYDDKGFEALSHLQNLEFLMAGSPAITDEGMAHLAKLPKLKTLHLGTDLVTNAGLVHVGKITSLENLTLKSHKYTLSGLNALNGLSNLRELHMKGMIQDDDGLDLSPLTNLEKIMISLRSYRDGGELRHDRIRAEDMAWLANINDLRWLQGLRGVNDEGLRHLAGLTKMERLSFSGPGITNDGLAHLANMKNLSLLSIRDCDITDAGLRHLEGLESMGLLSIESESACSRAAIERLRASLPNLHTLQIVP